MTSNRPVEETDYGFMFFLITIVIVGMGTILAKYAYLRHQENNYLVSNNCKVIEYSIKTNDGPKTLWYCNNGKHYVGNQVSF